MREHGTAEGGTGTQSQGISEGAYSTTPTQKRIHRTLSAAIYPPTSLYWDRRGSVAHLALVPLQAEEAIILSHVRSQATFRNFPQLDSGILRCRGNLAVIKWVPGHVQHGILMPRHLRVVDIKSSWLRERKGNSGPAPATQSQPHFVQRKDEEGTATLHLLNNGEKLAVHGTHVGLVRALGDFYVIVAFVTLRSGTEDMAKLTRTDKLSFTAHGECRFPSKLQALTRMHSTARSPSLPARCNGLFTIFGDARGARRPPRVSEIASARRVRFKSL